MVPRILLHIGLEKTGTTSIQITLRDNADLMAEHGIRFDQIFTPKGRNAVGNSLGLAAAALNKDRRIQFLRGRGKAWDLPSSFDAYPLDDIAAAANLSLIIFSSEQLSSWVTQPDEIQRLRDFLSRISDEITVVAYLRRQDRLVQSLANETIKGGGVFNYKRVDSLICVNSKKLSFVDTVRNYQEVFGAGNVILRPFAREAMADGDVVTDFARLAGIDHLPFVRPAPTNASLTLEALYVLSVLNDFEAVFGAQNGIRNARTAVKRAGHGRLSIIPRKMAQEIVERFAEDNAELGRMTGIEPFFDNSFDDFPVERPVIDAERVRTLLQLPAVTRVLGPYFRAGKGRKPESQHSVASQT